MNKLNYMALFVDVAHAGSIVRVAEQKGISSAAISKQIAILEKHLKVALFQRSNKKMSLTKLGEVYLTHCQTILDSVKEADLALSKAKKEPVGVLKLACGRHFAERFIIPYLPIFLKQHPKLSIDMQLSEILPDLKVDEIDIAFGSHKQLSNDLICRKVTSTQHILCASPAYLVKMGTPKKPADLHQHHYITHSFRQMDNVLTFCDDQQIMLKPLLRLNDAGAMLQAATHGAGIISLNQYIVEEAVKRGELVEILKKYSNAPRPIYLFYQKPRFIEPKIRTFIDFILSHAFIDD